MESARKKEGEFDFSGWLDLGKFIDMANDMGLYVILRPGPYICLERDMGGLPWRLLKYKDISLRTSQPLYFEKITPYLKKVCDIMRPRLITNGGCIIMVQVENEYGDVADDINYMNYIRDLYRGDEDKTVRITAHDKTRVSILVENMGRINGGKLHDRKGLIGNLTVDGAIHLGYRIYSAPLDTLPPKFGFAAEPNTPTFYEYTFEADESHDTVLHPEGFTRGVAFINGVNLGRHWSIEARKINYSFPHLLYVKEPIKSLFLTLLPPIRKKASVLVNINSFSPPKNPIQNKNHGNIP